MRQTATGSSLFELESTWKVLLKIAPPVMLAQLIQSLYNIVDSFFVGQYSGDGLTALSIIFPVQLIVTAIAVGTGVGVNTQMARYYARGELRKADHHRYGNGLGFGQLVFVCVGQLLFDAPLCSDLCRLAGCRFLCRYLRRHRLRW